MSVLGTGLVCDLCFQLHLHPGMLTFHVVNNNVILRIFRIFAHPEAPSATPKLLEGPPPSFSDLQILDPSGTYMVEACIRVEDRRNAKLAQQATQELQEFKRNLEGCIDLRPPMDFHALRTQVRET